MKQKISIIFLSLFFANIAFSQTYNEISEKTKHKIDSTFNMFLKKNKVVGASIAIVDNGKIVYSTGYGFSDKKAKTPADDKTVYRVGSISKSFTTLSVLQLHNEGKLNYENPLGEYLTDFSINNRFEQQNPILISNIMTHTAGLPCDMMNGFFATNPPDQKWIIKQIKHQYTIAPQNHMMAYSNLGYGLLGELIARTSNLTYEEYLTQNIFQPLQMTSSYVHFDENKNHSLSKCYIRGKEKAEPEISDEAAGLVHCSALDMANYTLMFLNDGKFNGKQILPENLIAEMEKDHISNIQLNNGIKYGYGLFINNYRLKDDATGDSTEIEYIGHGGDTFGYHADFGYIEELGIGAVILTNSSRGNVFAKCEDLINIYIQNEKDKHLEHINYMDNFTGNDKKIANDKIFGVYESPAGIIEVNDSNLVKFKQNGAKVVFKRESSKDKFSAKVVLLGFISIKLKGQEFDFVENNNQIYMKAHASRPKMKDYFAEKSEAKPIPQSWKDAFGKYEVTGKTFAVPDKFPYNSKGLKAELTEKDGFILFKMKGKSIYLRQNLYLNALDNKTAISKGYTRNTGYCLTILPNGNLNYSGFEFKKVK